MRVFSRWLAVALALPTLAAAQSTTVDEHLRRGVELRRDGRDDESLTEFEEAYRLSREPRTAAQLGLARQAVGRWLDADRLLREALASPDDGWVTRNRAALESALRVVGGHVGEVRVRGNIPGAEVRLEGVAVATLPMAEPVRVLAGMLSLEVAAEGYEPVSRRFAVEPRTVVLEEVELRAVAPPRAPPSAPVAPVALAATPLVLAPRDEGSATRRRWAAASLAAAGAALGFGTAALVVREDAATRYNDHQPSCPPPPARSGTPCADLEDTAGVWRTAAWVALPTGAALLATGIVLLLLPSRGATRAAGLSCGPLGRGTGLACAFVF